MDAALELRDLSVEIDVRGSTIRPVRDFDLTVARGESVAIVGESGSGKSTLLRAAVGLMPKHARTSGGVHVAGGANLVGGKEADWRAIRGRQVGFVFQDASAALDPLRRVGAQVAESVRVGGVRRRQDVHAAVDALLERVGLKDVRRVRRSFPHELSGGMKQRVTIAIALACDPPLLLCDEPTTAMDVVLQKAFLETLVDDASSHGTALVFVTHDLAVARMVCQRVIIMYGGAKVEEGPIAEVFANPRHMYTRALLASVPSGTEKGSLKTIPGRSSVTSGASVGCTFAPRCEHSRPECVDDWPGLVAVSEDHSAACIYALSGAAGPDDMPERAATGTSRHD